MKDSFKKIVFLNQYQTGMSKFDRLFKKLDRQKYPFIDGLYYLFILVFLLILFIFFS